MQIYNEKTKFKIEPHLLAFIVSYTFTLIFKVIYLTLFNRQVGLAAVLALMSVPTFKTDVILCILLKLKFNKQCDFYCNYGSSPSVICDICQFWLSCLGTLVFLLKKSFKLFGLPCQGHYGFHSFPVVDWFCLFIYLWVLTFPL